jgi:Arc/MetJ-type ribon-helix-helix transcriptional regulator
MPQTITLSIPRAQYTAIQKLIEEHPEWGYDSPSQAIKDAIRDWLLKKRLQESHFTVESKNEIELNGH